MVRKSAGQRAAIKIVWGLGMLALGVVVACSVLVGLRIAQGDETSVENDSVAEDLDDGEGSLSSVEDALPEVKLPDAVELQGVVDEWVSSVGGRKGVVIYDLDRSEVTAEYNADVDFETASLYKLYVVYEGYRRVSSGEWSLEDRTYSDGRTIGTCLDAAIRSSDSSCAEGLWAMIGHDEMLEIIRNDYKIAVGDSILVATPRQIMDMMRIYVGHEEVAPELIDDMWDSFLNQPVTTNDWRRGLPSGFSSDVLAYNKVGWEWYYDDDPNAGYWRIYDDAAVIEVPIGDETGTGTVRRFIVVVMTSGVGNRKIAELGTMIEGAVKGSGAASSR